MTDQNQSFDDALTYRLTEFDVLLDEYLEALQDGPRKEQVDARNELRLAYRTALLAAFPVEQPAAAPINEAEEMRDAAMRTVQAMGLIYTPGSNRWRPNANHAPAPSPADERAALSEQDIYDKFSFLEGLVNESTYVEIADTAIEIARAASANETEAAVETRAWETDDGRVISDVQKQQALRDGGASASSVRPFSIALGRIGAVPAMAAEPTACKGKNCGSLDPRFHSAECFEEYEKTVGLKPAQADVRVGLTDEQRNALKLAIDFIASSARQDRGEHVARIRALLDNDRA